MIRIISHIVLWFFSSCVLAEPWINTSDLQLRSDIEILADLGVIKVPITTYPLMWAGIIKNIDETDIQGIDQEYKGIFWRVKKRGKAALNRRPKRLLKVSVASSEQVFRSFGDSSRGKLELVASNADMSKTFAWNMQVNRVSDPLDGDNFYYDGSYIAGVWGNWVVSVGAVEKWWGASWDSANLLSNNARTPVGVTLNRNYSDPSQLPLLKWLGPWRFTGLIARLEDTAAFDKPFLSGASFSFKPIKSLETSVRAAAISGGTAKPFSTNTPAKIITAFDLRWQMPLLPSSFYFSVTDEGQKGAFSTVQWGLSAHFTAFDRGWRVFVESTDTAANDLNITYEDNIYTNGYRLSRRAIGSTYDSDSKVVSLGLIGNISRTQNFSIKLQSLTINRNPLVNQNLLTNQSPLTNQSLLASSIDLRHSINQNTIKAKRILSKWQWQYDRKNQLDVTLDYSDKVIDSFGRQNGKFRLSVGWVYFL